MKLTTWMLVAATGLLLTAGSATAETAQQEKMKTCNADATAKGLKGDERQAFMKTCLSNHVDGSGKQLTPQQMKMRTCNADASAKKLSGKDRQAFMKTCLGAK